MEDLLITSLNERVHEKNLRAEFKSIIPGL